MQFREDLVAALPDGQAKLDGIAIGQAAAAVSFIVPKKPQASFWVVGMVCWVVIVISFGLIVATPV